jgi:hypothetical protein
MANQPTIELYLPFQRLHTDLGHGWGVAEQTCGYCGHHYFYAAPVHTIGQPCPRCGMGGGKVWLSNVVELSDGPWLTGQHEIPMMTVAAQ